MDKNNEIKKDVVETSENAKSAAKATKTAKEKKAKKAKSDKPSFFEKVAKFFRSLKSELRKIVWSPWKQVKKNTAVVLVVVVAFVLVIWGLDYAFSTGIINIGKLI